MLRKKFLCWKEVLFWHRSFKKLLCEIHTKSNSTCTATKSNHHRVVFEFTLNISLWSGWEGSTCTQEHQLSLACELLTWFSCASVLRTELSAGESLLIHTTTLIRWKQNDIIPVPIPVSFCQNARWYCFHKAFRFKEM